MKITPDTLTDLMIRELELSDLCIVCNCGLLAPAHHNNCMDDYHEFERVSDDLFITALYEFDYPSARIEARQRICDAINASNQDRCPGRLHRRHAFVICAGSCCTSCGGPIDEDSECRCDDTNARNGGKP